MDLALIPNLITGLTPVIVPLLIAALKVWLPRVPTVLLPIGAVALGVVLDYVNRLTTGTSVGLINGALLGAAGVALREIVDQLKKVAVPDGGIK